MNEAVERMRADAGAQKQDAGGVRSDYHSLVRSEVFPLIRNTGGALLDFGGGIGATAAALKATGRFSRVGVVDLMGDAGDGLTIDFRGAGDCEDPTFLKSFLTAHGPFDTILCLDILEHLRDPWAAMKILRGALSPRGEMILSIPNVRNYKALLPLLLRGEWELTDKGILDRTHLRFFVKKTAMDLARSSGLRITDVVASPSGGRKITAIRAATLGLLNSFTDRQYLIRAVV